MARDDGRPARIAAAIRREISDLIATEVKDPRVALAAVTDVEVSPDLGYAKVFVSSLDITAETDRGAEIVAGLEAAAGFLKKQLSRRLRLRVMPKLRFIEDTTERDAQALDRLIDSAVAADREHRPDTDDHEPDKSK